MGRSPCCSKVGMNRGAWTAFEDKILTDYIKVNGEGRWRNLPKRAGLKRCGKSCRLRWLNYLRPGIKRGNISHDEEELIIRLHKLLGNRWSLIAGRLPGRTDNEIKNYWNTALRKKVDDHHNLASTHKGLNKSLDDEKAASKTETSRHESHVVRTKAMRCTKGYFIQHPHKNEPIDSNTKPKQLVVDHNSSSTNPTELGSFYGVTPFTPGEDDPSNFMLDVDIGEVFASDLLKSDFSGLFESTGRDDDDNHNNFSPSWNGSALLTKEMLEDWILSDYVQPNVDSNHHCFASIPEFRDDWHHI